MKDDTCVALSESDLYSLLAHRRRRLTVRTLEDVSTPLSVSRLTELVCGCEHEDPTAESRRTVYVSLAHNHLPRLADADVVAYDPADDAVGPAENFDLVREVIATWRDGEESPGGG